jgi:hypothetical protein
MHRGKHTFSFYDLKTTTKYEVCFDFMLQSVGLYVWEIEEINKGVIPTPNVWVSMQKFATSPLAIRRQFV